MTKPIAFVTGYRDGYPVIQPVDGAAVLPVGMALYDHPAPDGAITNDGTKVDTKPVGKFAQFTDGIWREVTKGSAGVPLYTHPPVTSDMRESQIESAAKKLAEVMEYPWDYMPEQGKTTMRKNAVAVIEAALAKFK